MSRKTARRDIDLTGLPPLGEAEKADLAALAERPDSQIDYSDIPPLDEAFGARAVRGRFYRPVKTSTTVRIDSDVLEWFKRQGKGYQTRMNAALRREMLAALRKSG
jgi:uncharacterized protein (DUF4415 family)